VPLLLTVDLRGALTWLWFSHVCLITTAVRFVVQRS